MECFDSYGKKPTVYSDYIVRLIDDEYQVIQIEVLQADDSTVCGQYCMFFILVRAYGFSYLHFSFANILISFSSYTQW